MDEFKPLKVAHLKRSHVNIYRLGDILADFRMRTRDEVRYVILSEDDYRRLSMEAARYTGPHESLYLKQIYGVYVTPDPELAWGDVILLYEASDL